MIIQCAECGVQFSAKPSENRRFCSVKCYHANDAAAGHPKVQRIDFECKVCGTPFQFGPGQLRSYRKQWGKDPMYCSRKCGGIGRQTPADELKTNCLQCGKKIQISRNESGIFRRHNRLCSTECRSLFRSIHSPSGFAEGQYARHEKRHGYMWISIPAYASGTGKKREMLEHRYVMEQHLGRPLHKFETVHHKDGNRSHNAIENLELFASRHGPGQRVTDEVAYAIETLKLYPEFARAVGFVLVEAGEH